MGIKEAKDYLLTRSREVPIRKIYQTLYRDDNGLIHVLELYQDYTNGVVDVGPNIVDNGVESSGSKTVARLLAEGESVY